MSAMDIAAFRHSLVQAAPPEGLSLALQGLWWDARGDWNRAHACAQDQDDAEGAAVHAYLHRKEGDLPNARYWYARAGRPVAAGTLEQEWASLVDALLR
ncbi:hypothetical protein [Limobrevibacterium gyesilva]|uniref:Uncharacterized protein n=1 Tax=Limobrevibacterium gyesilva TaxID=2991712 RepID=A0AA42CFV7_9PROT|nr:hypothetical protein [Limobrevibacterium gyesilva]MCW3477079.1 hypothetical protein [Limobrevibacterium gyesilva]